MTVEIQGIQCDFRDLKQSYITEDGELIEGEEILYANLPQDEQYFRRVNYPFTDDELIDIALKEHTYSPLQKEWVAKQNKIFDEGVYASINGNLVFIPGAYWCYINFWTLEHGDKPDYREDDRLFFLFHEFLRLETNVLAVVRLKGRRQGATSIAMFFMWFVAGRNEHKLCGLTSFSDAAAQDAFQKMFMFGFKSLLPCFQEDTDSDSENFIRFVKPIERKKKGIGSVKREGLNSYCDYKSNVINSYDSGRQSYNVPDEGGKRNKLNINSYWSRLYKTFLVGSNKVGFGYLPTTVGAKREGGENFKLFWKNSNQFEINIKTGESVGLDTINRAVRYFVPATHCYAGCIDKFGNSVVADPEQPILSNEGKWIKEGSRTIILRERARLDGEQLMEHRRDYPFDEFDAFAFETGMCEFGEKMLIDRIQYLEENPAEAYWRQVRLFANKEGNPEWMDDPKGCWWIKEFPEQPNKFVKRNGGLEPDNFLCFSSGADTYRNIFAVEGSLGVIAIIKKSMIVEGVETGLYPVAFFIGRPQLIRQFNYEMYLSCLMYGCRINVESDAGTWFYEDFIEFNAVPFLEWTPARDPLRRDQKIKVGTESANPFQLAKQLEVAKIYFDGNDPINYNGNIHRVTYIPLLKQALEYNHSERTPYHLMVAFMMALIPMMGQGKAPELARRKGSIMPQYPIKWLN